MGEALLRLFDFAVPFFESDYIYRIPAKKYCEDRDYDKSCFAERIKYLKRRGLIEGFVEGKDGYIEITPKGLSAVKRINFDELEIVRTEQWDGKWRVVVFDITDKHKSSRDALRYKLSKLGFQKIQESVYVYPFECSEEIKQISEVLLIENDVLVMVSEIIQGEEDIIEQFLNTYILTREDIELSRK